MPEPTSEPGPGGATLAPGELVEHFEVVRLLGRGGMGEVYLVRDRKLDRHVALKLIRPGAFEDRSSLEAFLREARITARFSHPNIVTAYSIGEHRGQPFVALEYLEGETLRGRIDRGALAPDEAAGIALAVADALAEAHRHGVLHRDLKPDNVLIPPDGRPRVVDFGLAKATARDGLELAESMTTSTVRGVPGGESLAGGIAGTPFYMAPEQWAGGRVTAAADLWALGVMLHEMLTGQRPFEAPTLLALGVRVTGEAPVPPLPGGVPAELAALVGACLDRDPARRPAAAELADGLRSLLGLSGTRSLEVRIATGPVEVERPAASPRAWQRLVPALAGLVLLGVASVGALYSLRTWRAGAGVGVEGADGGPRDETELASAFPPRMESTRDLLRIGVVELPAILGSDVAPGVFWGLLHTEPDGRDVPFLVPSRPSEASGDVRPTPAGGVEVTWHLRPGLRWSDGHQLEAEDLVFSLQVSGDAHVVEARAADRRTLVVRWDDAVAAALDSIRPLPRHVLGGLFEREGPEAVVAELESRPTPTVGPYRVASFDHDRRLVLEGNPHFLGRPPSIRRVVVEAGAPEELLRRFEAAELDVIAPDVLSVEMARELLDRRPDAVHIRPSTTMVSLHPDLGVPPLDRAEVRRALLMAIDRVSLVSTVFGAEGTVAHVPAAGEPPAGVERYPYAPAPARAALAASGVVGRELPLVHGGCASEREIAAAVAEDLRAAGLRAEARPATPAERLEAFRTGRHGGLLLRSTRVFDAANLLAHWNLPRRDGRYDLAVRNGAFDERTATLVERLARALYAERRQQLRSALLVAYSERLPTLPLVFSAERVVVDPALRGWDLRPGDRFGRGLERWYFGR